MPPERVFVKGDRRVTTRVPAAAVRFLSEGFREVTDDDPVIARAVYIGPVGAQSEAELTPLHHFINEVDESSAS